MVLPAPGMADEQPSAIQSQRPFKGLPAAPAVLTSILDSLSLHGFFCSDEVPMLILNVD
ncbi:PA4575 family protein [Pseudomonas syringae group genomosp. 7]